MRHRVDVLLTGDDDPHLALAARTQLLHQRLQVEHHAGIVADVLPDFIDQEHEVEIRRFALHIFRNFAPQPLDAHFGGLFAVEPVACRVFAHARRSSQRGNHVVLPKRESFPCGCPRLGVDGFKRRLERFQLALPVQKAFQRRDLHVVAVITAMLVKYLRKYPQNRVLILAHRRFRVDVEQNRLRRHLAYAAHHRVAQRIKAEFILKIINGMLSADFLIRQQIRQDFKEMRFTASEKAADPYAHLVGHAVHALLIVIVKGTEMLAQFACDDVFLQLLPTVFVVRLHDLDYAVDLSVDVLLKHVVNLHLHVILSRY